MLKALRTLIGALPIAWQLAAAGAAIAAIAAGYLIWRHNVYSEGYDNAMGNVDERNSAAARDVREAVSKPRTCRDIGGRWDVTRGLCEGQIRDR